MTNTQNMTQEEAGDRLDRIAKEIAEEKGLSYEAALDRALEQNPALTAVYMPATAKR